MTVSLAATAKDTDPSSARTPTLSCPWLSVADPSRTLIDLRRQVDRFAAARQWTGPTESRPIYYGPDVVRSDTRTTLGTVKPQLKCHLTKVVSELRAAGMLGALQGTVLVSICLGPRPTPDCLSGNGQS